MDFKKIRDIRGIPAYVFLAGLVVFLCLLIVFPVHAKADQEDFYYTDRQGIRYDLYGDGTCIVSGYTEELQSTVRIPSQISYEDMDYIVRGIDGSAFEKCSRLRTIEIPDQVTDLPAGTFSECSKLKNIYILPTNVKVKKSGKNTVITVKISNVWKEEAGRVQLEVDEDVVQKAASQKSTDTVTLFLSDLDSKRILLQESAVKAIAGSGKDLKVRIRDSKGSSCYRSR